MASAGRATTPVRQLAIATSLGLHVTVPFKRGTKAGNYTGDLKLIWTGRGVGQKKRPGGGAIKFGGGGKW